MFAIYIHICIGHLKTFKPKYANKTTIKKSKKKKKTMEGDHIREPGFSHSPAEFLGEIYTIINQKEEEVYHDQDQAFDPTPKSRNSSFHSHDHS